MPGVLIVDQSAALAREVIAVCQSLGLEVAAVARDGIEAVEQAVRLRPDMVVLDLLLPRLSGTQVMASLARHGLTPVVVVVTAVTARESILAARQAGAHAYLLKPLATAKLTEVLSARRADAPAAVAFASARGTLP